MLFKIWVEIGDDEDDDDDGGDDDDDDDVEVLFIFIHVLFLF